MPDVEGVRKYVLARLASDLPPEVRYHTLEHTETIVVPAALRLAAQMCVQGIPRILLQTGSYFHDVGFVEQPVGHEEAGARIAAQILPAYGYSEEQIDAVRGMIIATRLPQSPQNLLEQIVADADLDVLGRADFVEWNQKLREEIEAFGRVLSDEQWLTGQIRFLRDHRYFTAAAREWRDEGKQQNLQSLEAMLVASAQHVK